HPSHAPLENSRALIPTLDLHVALPSLPVVKLFGDTQMAWVKAMTMWCVIALAMLLICFANCKERVQIEAVKNQQRLEVLYFGERSEEHTSEISSLLECVCRCID